MATRITKEVLYLKHEFSKDERLEMGTLLAQAHNRMADIEAEESVMKAQIRDRKAGVEQSIGTLSRNLGNGYEMRNIDCELEYDTPNVGEVTYKRKDNGQYVKHRAMTDAERQMDLPLETEAQAEASAEQSSENIANFFDPTAIIKAAEQGAEPAQENAEDLEDPVDPFTDPDPAAAAEAVKPENDDAFEGKPVKEKGKPGRKPRGFDSPTNPSAIADF